jgi:hypothetical protein
MPRLRRAGTFQLPRPRAPRGRCRCRRHAPWFRSPGSVTGLARSGPQKGQSASPGRAGRCSERTRYPNLPSECIVCQRRLRSSEESRRERMDRKTVLYHESWPLLEEATHCRCRWSPFPTMVFFFPPCLARQAKLNWWYMSRTPHSSRDGPLGS